MIKGIKVINGFFTELPGFKPNEIFEFHDGLNVLFGPNGCGKTSLLKMLKAYCGIPNDKAGWSRISDPISLGTQSKSHFPYAYRQYSPGHSDCIVLWDGTPSFYNEGNINLDQWAWFTHNSILSEDGMTTEQEMFDYMAERPSSGQFRIKKLNKLFNMLKKPPSLTNVHPDMPDQRAEVEYIKSLNPTGRITLLLDEPERALSLPKQVELFKLLEEKSSEYQIIIATHSPFVLYDLKGKIFDLHKGYVDECINIIDSLGEKQLKFEF